MTILFINLPWILWLHVSAEITKVPKDDPQLAFSKLITQNTELTGQGRSKQGGRGSFGRPNVLLQKGEGERRRKERKSKTGREEREKSIKSRSRNQFMILKLSKPLISVALFVSDGDVRCPNVQAFKNF